MKLPALRPLALRLAILSGPILMTGCAASQHDHYLTTLKASLDFANTHEHGQSEISYDAENGENLVVFTEMNVDGFSSEESVENGVAPTTPKGAAPFTIGAGLEYIGKGNKLMGTKTHLNYLEIPVLLLYHYPVSDKGTLYGGAGPYLAYGIGGKVKGQNYTEKSFSKDNYKRVDGGLEFMAGYKLPMGLSLDLAYDFGLANIAHAGDDYSSHNRSLSINVGYSLDKLIRGK